VVTTTTSGSTDISTDGHAASGSGSAGVSVNGVGVSVGGGLGVDADDIANAAPDVPNGPNVPTGPRAPNGPGGSTPGGTAGLGQPGTGQSGSGSVVQTGPEAALAIRTALRSNGDDACSDDTPNARGATAEEIGLLADEHRLGLVLLCEGEDRLTVEQRSALRANAVIAGVLRAAGVGDADVLAAQPTKEGALVLYVRRPA
jgi:hypothetical protein